VFEQGTFVWGVTRSAWLAILIAVAGATYAALTYRRVARQATGRDRAILMGLRLAAIATVLFCLMRPALILKAAVPQQNFLGVLVDDSRSMQIPDEDNKPRGQFITDNFSAADSPMLAALTQRFAVRQFKFATNAERIASSANLTFLQPARPSLTPDVTPSISSSIISALLSSNAIVVRRRHG